MQRVTMLVTQRIESNKHFHGGIRVEKCGNENEKEREGEEDQVK